MRSVVRLYPGPPSKPQVPICGAVAQLGEHLLCKQGVTGSIPVSSTKKLIGCFLIVATRCDADQETGWQYAGWFQPPQGGAFLVKVWMFDNEIDWVTCLECNSTAVRRLELQNAPSMLNTRPSTSNEPLKFSVSCKCSSKKSVFRSYGFSST